jgi:uncharacterized membrane protein YoaK (UPF0700 family)
MFDRVVDLAAEHGESADLAVRDWLLVGLSFSAGMYEAICFLTFGKVFAGFQTGDIMLLGVGIAGTRPPAGPNPVTVVISLAAFAVGVALAVPILKAFGPGQETADQVHQVWPRRVSIALAIGLIPQAAFLAVWIPAAAPASLSDILIALAALAMGLQINAVRSLQVPGISTTAFTATYVGLVTGLVVRTLAPPAAWRLTATIVGLAAGGFLGDWMLSHAHTYAPVVPAVVTAVVIVIAWVALKPRATAGPAGAQGVSAPQAVQ